MSHATPNTLADLRKRFVQAAGYWTSPGIRPNEAQFRDLWFGSRCALLEYAAATGGDFDDETQKCLSSLVALPAEKYEAAATTWLQRIHVPNVNVPKSDVTNLVNSVTAIVHALAAVQQWRLSRWGGDPIAIESARKHVKTCWQSYAAALPVDGPPKMHDCNHYLHDTKLSGLLALLNEPTTATHWLMLQRLFDHLLQNASDDQHTRTRSASEATESIGTEKASLARRVRMPAPEHEVHTHLVGVPVYDKTEPRTESERHTVTKLLTVSRVAEGPTGWYLDPIALGATRIDPEILNQLQLSWLVATSERQAHRAATVRERTTLNTPLPNGRGSPSNSDDPLSPLRITIASDGLPSLEGRSAGGLLLLSLHAAANDGFLREDTTASFDIKPIRKVQNGLNRSAHHAERDGYVAVTAPRDEPNVPQHPTELRLSDIQALPVDSATIKQKNFGLDDAPYIKRFLVAQTQTVRDANGPETTFANWSQQHATRYPVEFVPITNALDAWQQVSGGPQIEATKRYLNGVINQANNVANYLEADKERVS